MQPLTSVSRATKKLKSQERKAARRRSVTPWRGSGWAQMPLWSSRGAQITSISSQKSKNNLSCSTLRPQKILMMSLTQCCETYNWIQTRPRMTSSTNSSSICTATPTAWSQWKWTRWWKASRNGRPKGKRLLWSRIIKEPNYTTSTRKSRIWFI